MQVDELTWLGADVRDGGGQKRKRAEVRLSVWNEQPHQDALIGKAAVPASTVRSALEARQLISVDLFASKRSTVKTGVLDLSLKVERFANAEMLSRAISGGWQEGDDVAAAKYDNEAWLQVGVRCRARRAGPSHLTGAPPGGRSELRVLVQLCDGRGCLGAAGR